MKLFWALVAKFDDISDKLEDLFDKEYPWIFTPYTQKKVQSPNGAVTLETIRTPHIKIPHDEERQKLVRELCIVQEKISKVIGDMTGVTARKQASLIEEAEAIFSS